MTLYCKPIIFKDEVGNSGHMPVYMTKEAACADVTLPCDVTIYPGEVVKIDLLIGFEIPNGYKLVMYPRSSLLFNNSVLSPTSIIDSDYSGKHVHWPAVNVGKGYAKFEAGTRVAQIELVPCTQVANWGRKDAERAGGFGSTGEGK